MKERRAKTIRGPKRLKKKPKKLEVRMVEQNKLLEAANTTLREDNAKLRKKVKELEERTRGLSRSLAAREADVATAEVEEKSFKSKFAHLFYTVGVLADAVNGTTTVGRMAKESARKMLAVGGIPIPSSLATRAVKKAVKKRTSRKKS